MSKLALITGASKGIGKALAIEFAKHQYSLLLLARDLADLQAVQQQVKNEYQCDAKIASIDLTHPRFIDHLIEAFGEDLKQIDVLINNAGIGFVDKFTAISAEKTMNTMIVDMVALTQLTHYLLPWMIKRNQGCVLNIASTSAFLPGPNMAVYYASKVFVLSLTEALYEEYRNDGIHFSALCPGLTKTKFFERAGMLDIPLVKSSFFPKLTPEQVAKVAYKGLMKKKRIIVPGWSNQLTVRLIGLFPRWLTAKVVKKLQSKPKR